MGVFLIVCKNVLAYVLSVFAFVFAVKIYLQRYFQFPHV